MSAAKRRNLQRPVRAGDCRKLYACRVTGKTGTPSQRVTWCCTERHGFMLKHWKCVGLGHRDCPNNMMSDQSHITEAAP